MAQSIFVYLTDSSGTKSYYAYDAFACFNTKL